MNAAPRSAANLALYRRYRPGQFSEVVGQEHVTEPLAQALRNGRINHAFLFSGPRGCGKTSSARILARSLNCEQGPTPEPCGKCDSCLALAPNGSGSLDVIEIDAASNNGVDDARDLRERAFFSPVSSRFKIYIIDEAHMVTTAAFNALLKLVEEPPEFVKFVFATTEPEKVLATIRSRTHHYPFRLIPPQQLREHLERICTAEGVKVEPTVLPLVVRAGGGSARDSLSVLDQLLAGAGEEGVTYARAVSLLGVTDAALLDEICDALGAADGAGVFRAVDRVVEAGHDPRRFAADLLERLRDLIVIDRVPDAAKNGLITNPPESVERMTGQAIRLGAGSLSRMADIVHDGLVQMRGTTSPRLVLELVCARMLLPGGEEGYAAVMQRVERLERRLEIASETATPATPVAQQPVLQQPTPVTQPAPVRQQAPEPIRPPEPTPAPAPAQTPVSNAPAEPVVRSQPSPPPAAAPRPAPTPAPQPAAAPSPPPASEPAPPAAAGAIDTAAVRRVWDQVMERVKGIRRAHWSALLDSTPAQIDGDTLTVTVKNRGNAVRLSQTDAVEAVSGILRDLLGVRWRLRYVPPDGSGGPSGGGAAHGPAPTPAPTPPPAAPAPAPSAGGWPEVRQVPSGGATPPADSPAPVSPPPSESASVRPEQNGHAPAAMNGGPQPPTAQPARSAPAPAPARQGPVDRREPPPEDEPPPDPYDEPPPDVDPYQASYDDPPDTSNAPVKANVMTNALEAVRVLGAVEIRDR